MSCFQVTSHAKIYEHSFIRGKRICNAFLLLKIPNESSHDNSCTDEVDELAKNKKNNWFLIRKQPPTRGEHNTPSAQSSRLLRLA